MWNVKERMWANKVIVTVKSVKGKCPAGLKVGDKIVLIGDNVEEGNDKVCLLGMYAIWPLINTMVWAGKIPPDSPFYVDKDTVVASCPDSKNLVVFEMRKVGACERRPDTKGEYVPKSD